MSVYIYAYLLNIKKFTIILYVMWFCRVGLSLYTYCCYSWVFHLTLKIIFFFPGESPRGEWEGMSSSALFLNTQNACHCHHIEVPQPLSHFQTRLCTIYKIYIEVMWNKSQAFIFAAHHLCIIYEQRTIHHAGLHVRLLPFT